MTASFLRYIQLKKKRYYLTLWPALFPSLLYTLIKSYQIKYSFNRYL